MNKNNDGSGTVIYYQQTTNRDIISDNKSEETKQKLKEFRKNETNFENIGYHQDFSAFKKLNYKRADKIKKIDDYINDIIVPLFLSLYIDFENMLKDQNGSEDMHCYIFDFLKEKMNNKLKDIKLFFEIFDFIKNELDNMDYNLFIKRFLESMKIIDNLVNIWKFINNIYMLEIYNNLISKNLSILNDNNNLCKALLFNIIDNDFFQGEYFFGLFDYIYFKDQFIIGKFERPKGIYDKFKSFHNELYFINENNYTYLYESIKEIKENINELKWNKYIKEQYKNNELEIIYNMFDFLDSNNYICRKNFYLKIFETIINKKEYLDNITFINALIALIDKDKLHIFEIFSEKDNELKEIKENEEEEEIIEYQELFEKLIKIIVERIFNSIQQENKLLDKIIFESKEAEIVNSLILFIKLIGEFNCYSFHKIMNKNLNENLRSNNKYISINVEEDENKDNIKIKNDIKKVIKIKKIIKMNNENNDFIVIKKLYFLYFQYIYLFRNIPKQDSNEFNKLMENWKNALIVFHSLMQCIIEYTKNKESLKKKFIYNFGKYDDDIINALNNLLMKIIYKYLIDESKFIGNENSEIIDENINIIFFILNNFTLLDKYKIQFLNEEFSDKYKKFLCDKTIILMLIYFRIILDCEKSIDLHLSSDKINEDKKILLELYINNKIKNKQLFYSILLNYHLAFLLTQIKGFEEINSFFYINNEKNNVENVLKILNENTYLKGDGRELIVLFSFLQEIHDIIEIKSNKKIQNFLFTLYPKNFGMKRYSYLYFSNHIDYTDRETKLSSIYNYLECFLYEMYEKNIVEKVINYKFFEVLNYLSIIIENILLIKFYSKSTQDTIEKYNQIENRQNFSIFSYIVSGVHISLLLIIIIIWFFRRAYIDYLYSLKKY